MLLTGLWLVGSICSATIAGAYADDTFTRPSWTATGASGSRPSSGVFLRGGAEQDSAPLSIIQRKRDSSPFDAALKSRIFDSDFNRTVQQQARLNPQLQGLLDDRAFSLQAAADSRPFRLRAQVRQEPPCCLPLVWLRPAWAPQEPAPRERPPRLQSLDPVLADEVSRTISRQSLGSFGPGDGFTRGVRGHMSFGPMLEFDTRARSAASSSASPEISGKLLAPPHAVPDVEAELKAKQNAAKSKRDEESRRASTAISLVFRRQTPVDLEVTGRLFEGDTGENGISWDSWYERVAKLSEPLIVQSVESSGGPSGANVVSITVDATHHILLKLVKGGNPRFDAAIMQAYSKLDGKKSLAFPAGSKRTKVTFLADNEHAAAGLVSNVTTQTCVGDTELSARRTTTKTRD